MVDGEAVGGAGAGDGRRDGAGGDGVLGVEEDVGGVVVFGFGVVGGGGRAVARGEDVAGGGGVGG